MATPEALYDNYAYLPSTIQVIEEDKDTHEDTGLVDSNGLTIYKVTKPYPMGYRPELY
jgi:hypothetical protein